MMVVWVANLLGMDQVVSPVLEDKGDLNALDDEEFENFTNRLGERSMQIAL